MRKPKTPKPVRSSELASLPEIKPSDAAKLKLVDIWLEFDGNEAKAILQAFQLGFKDGVNRAG